MAFDLRTHIRDPKTGRVAVIQPYRLHVVDGRQVFERAGKFYVGSGEEISSPFATAAAVVHVPVQVVKQPNLSPQQLQNLGAK